MSDLETSMVSIIDVFHKYSGHKCYLKKADLKDLINHELKHFIKKVEDDETVGQVFSDLDQNRDEKLDMKEFLTFIAKVLAACYKTYVPQQHAMAPTHL
ncbi:protein S100-B-like [Engraulis encrasicolus]|uniref:protein S100-B-like n=1 Tax=Engraulis encrasicolus TaxID=184585 RepID=UPI002FD0ECB0